jgi:hypothetical protein
VGLQEVYELSVELMLRELGVNITIPVKREREQVSKTQSRNKQAILNNRVLMERALEVNTYDTKLYALGMAYNPFFFCVMHMIFCLAKQKFCNTIGKYEDLRRKLQGTKVSCS